MMMAAERGLKEALAGGARRHGGVGCPGHDRWVAAVGIDLTAVGTGEWHGNTWCAQTRGVKVGEEAIDGWTRATVRGGAAWLTVGPL
jgi:hypothetical protein